LWQIILELNAFGPILEGVYYPDTYKMNVTLQYLKYILAKQGVVDVCCEYIDRKFQPSNSGVNNSSNKGSYVETFCTQMMSDYYQEHDDLLQRKSIVAYRRIYSTIHAKMCFAEIFLLLLQHQLRPIVFHDQQKDNHRSNNNLSSDYHSLPIIRDILLARRGAKDMLESMTKACAILWIQYSVPLLYCYRSPVSDDPRKGDDDDDAITVVSNSIQRELLRLTELLGIGISYMAWLYSKEMNESPFALAEVIGQVFLHEIDLSKVAVTKENQWIYDSIKLRFILSIQKEVKPQLRPKLAERFEVVGLYNTLYG
jgi:hypothetical protein